MPILRICVFAATVLTLAACGPAQVSHALQSWCRSADKCDDHSRPHRP